MLNIPDKIIVHHSASPRDRTSPMDINDWHFAREFTKSSMGYFIGYHYVIVGTGGIFQARAELEEGCHTIGENTRSIGICLTGNFDTEIPSIAQEKALAELLQKLCNGFNIPISKIYPHRHFKNTSCYGAKLDDWWAQRVAIGMELSTLRKIILWIQEQLRS